MGKEKKFHISMELIDHELTEDQLTNPEDLKEEILEAFTNIAKNNDLVLIGDMYVGFWPNGNLDDDDKDPFEGMSKEMH